VKNRSKQAGGAGRIVVLVFAMIATVSCGMRYSHVREMSIGTPDLSRIGDGAYEGSCAYDGSGEADCRVAVTVRDHRIQAVRVLQNEDSSWARRAEGVLPRIVLKQTPNVDAVSGATITSKALMKAVENALTGAGG
jgi:uncharacterized protein with FMN-binding domain